MPATFAAEVWGQSSCCSLDAGSSSSSESDSCSCTYQLSDPLRPGCRQTSSPVLIQSQHELLEEGPNFCILLTGRSAKHPLWAHAQRSMIRAGMILSFHFTARALRESTTAPVFAHLSCCVCTCMCVCLYVYIYTHTHACMHTRNINTQVDR